MIYRITTMTPWLKVLVVVMVQIEVTSSFEFTAVCSKAIAPHSTIEFYVTLENNGTHSPVLFTAKMHSNFESYESDSVKINPGNTEIVSINVEELRSDAYSFTVMGKGTGEEGEEISRSKKYVHIFKHQGTIIIESDKPVYLEGQTVKYRAILLNKFMKPFDSPETLEIVFYDPNEAVMLRIEKAKLDKFGFYSSSYELPPLPVAGTWSIEITGNKVSKPEMYQFEVQYDRLSEFKVEIEFSKTFVTFNDSVVNITIIAEDNFQIPIIGNCTVTIEESDSGFGLSNFEADIPKSTQNKSIHGKTFFIFDVIKSLKLSSSMHDRSKRINIVAVVKNCRNGREMTARESIVLHKSQYKADIIDKPESYKPGFPVYLTLYISTQDGKPVSDPDPDALKIFHGFSYTTHHGALSTSIPKNGLVKLKLWPPTNEYLDIKGMEIIYKDLRQFFEIPRKTESPSKTYLVVKPHDLESIDVPSRAGFKLISNKKFSSINYLLLSQGKILEGKRLTFDKAGMQHEFYISMKDFGFDSCVIIIYTVFSDAEEVIVDGFNLQLVSDRKPAPVELTWKEIRKTGSDYKMKMDFKGPKNSLLAVKFVDKKAYKLKHYKLVDQSYIDEREKNFIPRTPYFGTSSFSLFEANNLLMITNVEPPDGYERDASFHHSGFSESELLFLASLPSVAIQFGQSVNDEIFSVLRNKNLNVNSGINAARKIPNHGFSDLQHLYRYRRYFSEPNNLIKTSNFDQHHLHYVEDPPVHQHENYRLEETYAWDLVYLNEGGDASRTYTVPSVNCYYLGDVYSVTNEFGITPAERQIPHKLSSHSVAEVFHPSKLKLDEIGVFQVHLRNNLHSTILAKFDVTHDQSNFKLLEEFSDIKKTTGKKWYSESNVKSNDATLVHFIVKAEALGTAHFRVKIRDGTRTPITLNFSSQVVPTGMEMNQTRSYYIDSNENNGMLTVFAKFPLEVKKNEELKLRIAGDLMAVMVGNIDDFLDRKPLSIIRSGEHNLINFFPSVILLDYLTQLDLLSTEISHKVISNLKVTYERELQFRNDDNGFRYLEVHSGASTWLTALVLLGLSKASTYMTVDTTIISEGLKFLSKRQQAEGYFSEHGIKGRLNEKSSDDVALTAFVLLAFYEIRYSQSKNNTFIQDVEIQKANYAIKNAAATNDPFVVNILSYYTSEVNHPKREFFFEASENFVKIDKDSDGLLKYWEMEPSKNYEEIEESEISGKEEYNPISPSSVEVTAYGLLAYLSRGNVYGAVPIARWLIKRRGLLGEFYSTYDNFIANMALAKYDEEVRSLSINVKVDIGVTDNIGTAVINDANALILNEYELQPCNDDIVLSAQGRGSANVQLSFSYVLDTEQESYAESDGRFQIEVQAFTSYHKDILHLEVCLDDLRKASLEQGLMEIQLPSGYEFYEDELHTLQSLVEHVTRSDLVDDNAKLLLYINSLNIKLCFTVQSRRQHLVATAKGAYVSMQDLQDVSTYAVKFYKPSNPTTIQNICQFLNKIESNSCDA